ncbi:MAG: S8 family serine peptidase [Thermoleophilia bacterium]|nr:S8 family serine peptidase [Thermoleophilia bacterium]
MPLPLRRAHTVAAVLSALLACALVVPATLHAATARPQLIVGFRPTATVAQRRAVLGRAGIESKSGITRLRATVVRVAPGRLEATRRALLRRPGVAWVEVDHVAHAYGEVTARQRPNDTFLSQQWALATIGAEGAWDFTRGAGTTIAVLDTGVDYIHPDLSGHVDLGHDFVDNDDDPMDVQGHGTHVAGIAAATQGDGFGVSGVAPEARILAVRVLDADGAGNYSQVAQGITYAVDKGATVINLSLGGDEQSEVLHAALDYAAASGAIVTCAAGNEGSTRLGYPASYDSCLSVGATDVTDSHAPFSNAGPGLDVSAPGVQVLSSVMGGSHDSWDGTSMASPHVAGLAALLKSQGLSQREVIDTILGTAHDLGAPGYDTTFGAGRIDVAAAVQAASRQPRAAADTTAPQVQQPEVRAVKRLVRRGVQVRWLTRSRTGFKRVGTSTFRGSYAYSKTTRRGNRRTIDTFRYRSGIVYRRRVVQVRTRRMVRTVTVKLPISVQASDDVAVDRVAVKVDGRVVGLDRTAADGWSVTTDCTKGTHDVVAQAWDAADNHASASRRISVRC